MYLYDFNAIFYTILSSGNNHRTILSTLISIIIGNKIICELHHPPQDNTHSYHKTSHEKRRTTSLHQLRPFTHRTQHIVILIIIRIFSQSLYILIVLHYIMRINDKIGKIIYFEIFTKIYVYKIFSIYSYIFFITSSNLILY